jgi:hypothetical protein
MNPWLAMTSTIFALVVVFNVNRITHPYMNVALAITSVLNHGTSDEYCQLLDRVYAAFYIVYGILYRTDEIGVWVVASGTVFIILSMLLRSNGHYGVGTAIHMCAHALLIRHTLLSRINEN